MQKVSDIALPVISELIMNISGMCNLRCIYCYAKYGFYQEGSGLMTEDIARRSVDFLFGQLRRRQRVHIVFFGGEPILNWDVLRFTIHYAKSIAKKDGRFVTFGITTNGTLLDKEKVDFLRRNRFSIMISIDSHKKEINDRLRPAGDGKSTYNRILKALRLFDKKDYIILRLTLTKENRDIVNYIKFFTSSFDCVKEIAFDPLVAKKSRIAYGGEDLLHYKDEIYRYLGYLSKNWVKGDMIPVCSFGPYIYRLKNLYKYRKVQYCKGGRTSVAISPQGNIYSCATLIGCQKFYLGNVFEGLNNEYRRRLLQKLDVDKKERCKICDYRIICGGGCYFWAYTMTGRIDAQSGIYCKFSRINYCFVRDLMARIDAIPG